MAKKTYTEVGGGARQARKVYTEVGLAARKVKKIYAEVGGVAKLIFQSLKPFRYTFSTYPYQSISISSYCQNVSMFAGYNANGLPCIDMFTWNATKVNGGEPAGRISLDFINPAELVGKTIQVTYTCDFNTKESGNSLWWYYIQNNGIRNGGSLNGPEGQGLTFSFTVPSGTTSLYLEAVAGADGNVGVDVILTSVKVDGEEVLT